jgi:threonyl-tRNA synthetase
VASVRAPPRGRSRPAGSLAVVLETTDFFTLLVGQNVGHHALDAALLEGAATMDTPQLPTWLSPTQVRFIPVNPDAHLGYCEDLADDLEAADIRVDIDDRDESVGRRIAGAETEWVPYYVVIGDDEIEGDEPGVNVRTTGEERDMSLGDLRSLVEEDVGDLPQRPRYLPRHVSDHPNFTGG